MKNKGFNKLSVYW